MERKMKQEDTQIKTIAEQFEFDGHQMTALTYKGQPAVIAKEFGQRLGYSKDGGKLVSLISDEWKGFFEDGKHYVILRGKELSDFKELLKTDPSYGFVLKGAHIMLLFKPGMYKVAFKSGKPEAEPLIDFVVDHVFPQLEADGHFFPERTMDATGEFIWRDGRAGVERNFEIQERYLAIREREFKMNVTDRSLRLRESKEQRLLEKEQKLFEKERRLANKEQRLNAAKMGKALRLGAKYRLKLGRITEEQYAAACLSSYEIEAGGRIGTDDSDSTQKDGKLYSPTKAAYLLRVKLQTIGRAVTRIGERLGIPDIRKDERYVSPCTHSVEYTDGSSLHPDGYLMRENLFQMVKSDLRGHGTNSGQMNLPID
jgi:prophage antirepressor-like protein